jgi:hypothetical protein
MDDEIMTIVLLGPQRLSIRSSFKVMQSLLNSVASTNTFACCGEIQYPLAKKRNYRIL